MDSIEIYVILEQVLSVLDYLHKHDLPYSNFDPDQLLFNGNSIKVHNLEFSILQKSGKSNDYSQGDIKYLAPELLMGEKYQQSSDLWSFGVLAYFLFTGQHPFSGKNKAETMSNIVQNKPKIPLEHLTISDEEKEFLYQILTLSSDKRIKIDKIWMQKYFTDKKVALENRVAVGFKAFLNDSQKEYTCSDYKSMFLLLFSIYLNETGNSATKDVQFLYKSINVRGNGRLTQDELTEKAKDSPDRHKKLRTFYNGLPRGYNFIPLEYFIFLSADFSILGTKESLTAFFRSFNLNQTGELTMDSLKDKISETDICLRGFFELPVQDFSLSQNTFLGFLSEVN